MAYIMPGNGTRKHVPQTAIHSPAEELSMVDVLRVVSSLEPGQWVEFQIFEFDSLPGWDFLSRSIESKCDRVLENVVGSGYGWWYEISPINQHRVTFKRRKTPL